VDPAPAEAPNRLAVRLVCRSAELSIRSRGLAPGRWTTTS
jgi:hypothetical protein